MGSPQGTTTPRSPLVCHVIIMMCVKLIGCALSEGILCRLPLNAIWLVWDWRAAQGPWDTQFIGAAVENNAWSIAVTDEALCLPDIWRGTRLNAGDHLLSERGGWLDGYENSMFSVYSEMERNTPSEFEWLHKTLLVFWLGIYNQFKFEWNHWFHQCLAHTQGVNAE